MLKSLYQAFLVVFETIPRAFFLPLALCCLFFSFFFPPVIVYSIPVFCTLLSLCRFWFTRREALDVRSPDMMGCFIQHIRFGQSLGDSRRIWASLVCSSISFSGVGLIARSSPVGRTTEHDLGSSSFFWHQCFPLPRRT